MLDLSRKVLGKRLFSALMKSTFYGHFVAGEDQAGIRSNVENMMKYGVKSILDYSAEEDLADQSVKKSETTEAVSVSNTRKLYDPSEIQCEKNTKIFLDCIDAVSDVTNATGIAAAKLTSLIRPQLLLKLSSFMLDTKDQVKYDWKILLNKTDSEFSDLFNNTLKGKYEFTTNELGEIRNMLSRMDQIVEHAVNKNVRVFIDAEQTYFQTAIHRLTIELMRQFNKNKCVILNTYQNYLKVAINF